MKLKHVEYHRSRYTYICPHCGGRLDPGEKCDCMKDKKAAPMGRRPREYKTIISDLPDAVNERRPQS